MVAFKTSPIKSIDGIPIFSKEDEYISNYNDISSDHLSSVEESGNNPFIEEELWKDLESSTIKLIEKIGEPVVKKSVVLDVGVGTGRLLDLLDAKEKYGIDISMQYLKKVKKLGIDVVCSKVEDMPYENSSFDIVFATDIIEHVFDLNNAIEQITRVLKPKGYFLFRVPYKEDIEPYLIEEYPYEFSHLRNFDMSTIKALFTRIFDYEILDHCFSSPYYKPNNAKLRMLSEKSPLFTLLRSNAVMEDNHPLNFLSKLAISQEEIVASIYDLRDKHPNWFKYIESYIAEPLEISVLLQKK
tara:strand:- start:647 stop:1543 length:897 start_codon:yes stop_codon:yes gene_type:complete